jgi:hypothetical protein
MPFWELPTPALADRGIGTVSGMANVSCDGLLRPSVGGTASLPGYPMSIPEPITRRMPFWELPTPALADRGIVIVSGMANVSCGRP